MSALQLIEATVIRTGRRRRWHRAWRGAWQGFLIAAVLWLVALGLYKLLPIPWQVLPLAGVTGLLTVLAGFLAGWWRRERAIDTARWLDHRQHLQERLGTALEIGREPGSGEWGALVLNDAARMVGEVDVRRLLPLTLPRASRWSLPILALAAGLGFAPEYRSQEFLQRQREKESIRETGRNLSELTKRSLERRQPTLEATRQAVKSVGELGEQLARNPVSRTEALRDLAKMTDRVEQEHRELGKNPALRAIERAARSADKNSPASSDALQKQIESMQKALGSKEAAADALEKLRRELDKARQAAANMLGKDSQANAAAQESLANALSSLARQSTDLGSALPSLEEALAALKAGDIDQVLKNLEVAEKNLERLLEMAQALDKLQQQAGKLGKDLAEQLEKGQAEAAIASLQKMVNQLKAGDLSPERMKALMDEVAKAIDPAGPYGKVPDHLKEALRQMQAGQNAPAAQALADAAKELESLLDQLADAQDLKATLDALKRAQICVGTCQSWGACQGLSKPGFKPGGKPGRGVGTWADEDGWLDTPPTTGLWDNSGIERPDMESRGITDRGEGEIPEGMMPTKVKGQFQPGSQMPSITLKGVSIKGQSRVAIQEALQAAQSEAESALSHDKVPRAYAGSVKDYFDDLK
ncbi:MAG: hypothetical protein KA191_12460 [Verrucomicrobia bacterium]|jgi:tetratricopeptide (TPR) repeat protein|nr:hypothetical protein [Verrucomicrobiota bacterium]OQC67799.1 MAG: Chromosome partition protein Smc [Verrucomicrobia bacterium ADurb.Bin006]MDI9381412.1 hypothetical protein [Verrucomicrobiota bacterium]NMD21996.1 hypothetical protein [Verrucomicrobiota bacterium]HNU99333.1 hypothetical protein [Verrucomicrobiota bacterium]